MVLQTSNDSAPAIPLGVFARDVAARAEAAGFPMMPRNAGNRRTESKRAMLAELAVMGAGW